MSVCKHNLKIIPSLCSSYFAMDICFVDITVEFLAVAFHNILYYTAVYPKSCFETRKKYSIVVYRCIHPEVIQYIDLCLKSITECLKSGQLSRIVFAVTDSTYHPVIKFVFDLNRNEDYDDTKDAYLVQAEQNMRAFCLNLASTSHKFNDLPEDGSFTIHLHTTESTAVAMSLNPDLEGFPLVEVSEKSDENETIVPLRRFALRNHCVDTYIEMK